MRGILCVPRGQVGEWCGLTGRVLRVGCMGVVWEWYDNSMGEVWARNVEQWLVHRSCLRMAWEWSRNGLGTKRGVVGWSVWSELEGWGGGLGGRVACDEVWWVCQTGVRPGEVGEPAEIVRRSV